MEYYKQCKWSAQIECIGSEHHEKGSHNNVKKDIYAVNIFFYVCVVYITKCLYENHRTFCSFLLLHTFRKWGRIYSNDISFSSSVVALHEFKGHRSFYSQEYSSEMSAYWDCHCSLLPFLVFQRSFLVGYGRIFQRGHILHLEHPVSRA